MLRFTCAALLLASQQTTMQMFLHQGNTTMKTFFASLLLGSSLLAACGGEAEQALEQVKNYQSIAESANEAQQSQDAIQRRREERRAAGDTLAMPTDKLAAFLPASLDGYVAGEAETSTTEIPGMSMAQARRTYTATDGNTVTITLTDWNSSEAGWAGVFAVFALKMSVDNASETWSTFQDGDFIAGHQRFDKQSKSSSVQYGLGGRFHLEIAATNKPVDFVKATANKMDLKKLAAM